VRARHEVIAAPLHLGLSVSNSEAVMCTMAQVTFRLPAAGTASIAHRAL
jgi:hypothetical protein